MNRSSERIALSETRSPTSFSKGVLHSLPSGHTGSVPLKWMQATKVLSAPRSVPRKLWQTPSCLDEGGLNLESTPWHICSKLQLYIKHHEFRKPFCCVKTSQFATLQLARVPPKLSDPFKAATPIWAWPESRPRSMYREV